MMEAKASQPFYLGIDAGGTKTAALLISEDGLVVGTGEAGSANHVTAGLDAAKSSIVEAVGQALRGVDAVPAAIAFGSAGLEQPGDPEVARALLPSGLEQSALVFDTDAIIALEGALGGDSGIVVAAGTGSITMGRDAAGQRGYAGGWGWRAGDEGSAYWIGQRAITAVFKACDHRQPHTLLQSMVPAALQLKDSIALRDWLYEEDRTPADIARLASCVDAAAERQDEVATAILVDAVKELQEAALAVARQLNLPPRTRVSYTGGVFRSQRVRSMFTEYMSAPECDFVVAAPILPPNAGAALHAWRVGHALPHGPRWNQHVWQVTVPPTVVATLCSSIAAPSC